MTAAVLGTLAMADTALHLVPPQMQISPRTIQIARKYLLAPKWHRDFETLAELPLWQGQRLKTLLEHVNLANYTVNELVNWKVDDALYREFVLSPVIENPLNRNLTPNPSTELNWRRELWENFYPRVRHENTTSDAAVIVVRFLRQRVTIAPNHPKQPGVESMWYGHIVNLEDFEILYTATLRSVGVPARLNGKQEAEIGQAANGKPRPGLSQPPGWSSGLDFHKYLIDNSYEESDALLSKIACFGQQCVLPIFLSPISCVSCAFDRALFQKRPWLPMF